LSYIKPPGFLRINKQPAVFPREEGCLRLHLKQVRFCEKLPTTVALAARWQRQAMQREPGSADPAETNAGRLKSNRIALRLVNPALDYSRGGVSPKNRSFRRSRLVVIDFLAVVGPIERMASPFSKSNRLPRRCSVLRRSPRSIDASIMVSWRVRLG
jgi:hypothetical protein